MKMRNPPNAWRSCCLQHYYSTVTTPSVYNKPKIIYTARVPVLTIHILGDAVHCGVSMRELHGALVFQSTTFTGYSWRFGRPGNETIVM